jgi:DNA mismatch repair protein MutS
MKLIDTYFKELDEHAELYGKDKAIILMQVGSFYEAYQNETKGFDLDIISEITNCNVSKKDGVRMLGFPLQSLNKFLNMLVNEGFQVKVIEQNAIGKIHGKINEKINGKVERFTKGVYSKGTMIDLDNKDNNYILSLWLEKDDNNLDIIGVTICDIGTGVLEIKDCLCDAQDNYQALDEIASYINTYNPSEVILGCADPDYIWTPSKLKYLELEDKKYYISNTSNKLYAKIAYQKHELSKIFNQKNPIEYLEIDQYHYGRISLMMLLEYIEHHNKDLLKNLTNVQNYNNTSYLYLGNNAIQQLHVLSSDPNQNKIGNRYKSLYDVINFTLTPMGRRFLKKELAHPLINPESIQARYDLVVKFSKFLVEIKEDLQYICDMEKMHKKLISGDLHPTELYRWSISYNRIINLHKKIGKLYRLSDESALEIYKILDKTFDIEKLPSYSSVSNGSNITNIFLPGFDKEIDDLQTKIDENRNSLKDLAKFIEEYNTPKKSINCRVEFNERDGYHLITTKKRWKEIEESFKTNNKMIGGIVIKELVGKDNAATSTKIFSDKLCKISSELIKKEHDIVDKIQEKYREYCISFCEKYKKQINSCISWISYVDFIYSGAMCMDKYKYSIPVLQKSDNSWFKCEKIRHPIVERLSDNYVPFDMELGLTQSTDTKESYTGITLFGLNSAGKSTLQKSVGLNIILAQMGYPVACVKLEYSPYHSLFTRISGNDNLFKGLSSFSVEMLEIRNILKRTNNRSLIIADEVCRGTEYESGLIIVLTMIKLLSEKKANFITASHLHELVKHDMYKNLTNVRSFHIKILYNEKTNVITYNRELCPGSGDNFYGLLVAKSLIDDREFLQISTDIKNTMVTTKKDTSKYNLNIIKDECSICHKKVKDNSSEVSLETHHIIFQKDAVNNMINEYEHKNSSKNLVVICQKCHDDVDRGKINILGKVETSAGEELVIIPQEDIEKKVIELSKKKFSQKMIKEKLSKENINLSVSKIGKIISNNN